MRRLRRLERTEAQHQSEKKSLPPVQLFDLVTDTGERHNVASDHLDIVKSLSEELDQLVAAGRSKP